MSMFQPITASGLARTLSTRVSCPPSRSDRLRPSRTTRSIAFALSLIATAILALANGFSVVLCVEPDGCVEIEFVAAGDSSSASCVEHEHEPERLVASARTLSAECPCVDTVLVTLLDSARAKPAKAKSEVAPESASISPPSLAASLEFVAPRDRATESPISSLRTPSRLRSYSSYSRESVVLRT